MDLPPSVGSNRKTEHSAATTAGRGAPSVKGCPLNCSTSGLCNYNKQRHLMSGSDWIRHRSVAMCSTEFVANCIEFAAVVGKREVCYMQGPPA